MKNIKLEINHKLYECEIRDSELLIELLRDRLGLLGTKYSCLEGDCGVCTVVVNGKNILSCLTLAAAVRTPGSGQASGARVPGPNSRRQSHYRGRQETKRTAMHDTEHDRHNRA